MPSVECTIYSKARVLLLDEPLAALDAAAASLMEGLISSQVARGGMVVYTTHQETHVGGRILDLDARRA